MKPLSYDDLANFYTCHLINSLGKPLTFKPDKDMGEGEATTEELAYRQDLLDLAGRLYKVVGKRFKTIDNPSDLIRKIDSDINDFIQEGQKVVLNHIPKTWNAAQDNGMATLKRLDSKKKYDETLIATDQKDLIIQQQQMNIEDIGLRLRGRLRQTININAVRDSDKTPSHLTNHLINALTYPKTWTPCMIEQFQVDPTLTEAELRELCQDRDWEINFTDTQTNLDKAGMWGWLNADQLALLATLAMGTAVVGNLVADWVSQGDDRVCDDCLDLEANSPYSVLQWPDEPHFGCRCSPQNIRLET